MKKTIILTIAALTAVSVQADFTGEGYYRVQNKRTERWASMVDDKGSIDAVGTTADLQAIKLQKDFNAVCSDPASIIYIEPHGNQYSISAQGTNIYEIIGHYLNLRETGTHNGHKLYYASGTYEGVEKYIGDGELLPYDLSYAVTSAKGELRKWMIHPMETEGANFFGVLPTLESNGKHYATMHGDFPFATFSEGMKAYTVTAVGAGMALMQEVSGVVAKSTPVVFECSSDKPSDNRLEIGGEGKKAVGNKLKGAYFSSTENKAHLNFIRFDAETMRVLGICSDGSLGFITPDDLEYIPANTAFLPVEPGTPKELKCVSEAEYEAAVDGVINDSEALLDVYNVSGIVVLKKATKDQIRNLPSGIYIAGGKKFIIH